MTVTPSRPLTEEEAGADPRRGMGALFNEGFNRDPRSFADNRLTAIFRNSVFDPTGYGEVFANRQIPIESKASYVAGRFAHDLLTDGTRMPWWALNHPLAQVGLAGELVSGAAGLEPDYDVERKRLEAAGKDATRDAIDAEFARRHGFSYAGRGDGPPLTLARYAIPALATAAMTQFAGNTNYLNLLGGGRTPGFQAVLPVEGDPTQSSNPLLELGARYMFGRTGRVLPWEQFTQERPDVSYDDYKAYAAYQFDKGPLDLGLIRGTTRNLDGEPEAAMLGFRVPLSAATATVGSMAGGYLGATQADALFNQTLQDRLKLSGGGARRLAGAAIGSVLGAIGGKITGSLANDLMIQPILNPERVAAAERWQSLSPEQKMAIVKGKGGNQRDQGRQLALTQA